VNIRFIAVLVIGCCGSLRLVPGWIFVSGMFAS
jgi:hypothetical protein